MFLYRLKSVIQTRLFLYEQRTVKTLVRYQSRETIFVIFYKDNKRHFTNSPLKSVALISITGSKRRTHYTICVSYRGGWSSRWLLVVNPCYKVLAPLSCSHLNQTLRHSDTQATSGVRVIRTSDTPTKFCTVMAIPQIWVIWLSPKRVACSNPAWSMDVCRHLCVARRRYTPYNGLNTNPRFRSNGIF